MASSKPRLEEVSVCKFCQKLDEKLDLPMGYADRLRKFVARILIDRGKLRSEHLEAMLTRVNMEYFIAAFTHKSYRGVSYIPRPKGTPFVPIPENERVPRIRRHYEILEFLGDLVIDMYAGFHLYQRFPLLDSEGVFTKLKVNLTKGKTMTQKAIDMGFAEYALYGPELFREHKLTELRINESYLKMLEDIMEAFFGCVVKCVMDPPLSMTQGAGCDLAFNILDTLYGNIEIKLTDMKDLTDPFTRLKELYENATRGLGWTLKGNVMMYNVPGKQPGEDDSVEVKIYGNPDGTRTLLVRILAKNETDGKAEAAAKALKVLDEKYGIKESSKPITWRAPVESD